MEQFLRERHLIHRAARHHRILGGVGEHPPDIGDRTYAGHDFLEFLRRRYILEIEDLHYLVFVIATLGGIVIGDKNRVRGHRLPERVGQQGDVVERLFERRVVEIEVCVLCVGGLKLRIEDHVDSGQLAYRLVHHFRWLPVHLQSVDLRRDRLKLRHRHQRRDALFRFLAALLGRREALLLGLQISAPHAFYLVVGLIDFLKRDRR